MGNIMIVEISAFLIVNFWIILSYLMRDCRINKKSCYYRCKKLLINLYQFVCPKNYSPSPDLYVLEYIKEYYPKLDLKELDL
jgi:hypothetical protein